ncbi:hypothetical protein TREMEDRAFT_63863 [Tremella mesenterica DSM 1558]|uniref:uncharacterized protein n=1 Tax=Tremella mesenterica (strain ATCC 24925 / CBS 8224 / DSM 1558 / NBRC 9311 / NRRL Y-6157 / RJB 2259-6 / UBC 559-6) TaxID=578456 RepID=UPI0003F49FCF|nr:uncharacterized protein TREMEDRAFT_63863 [Tremella mesenterica DSM 1558]EIW67979.1 hypothetical protein TREMEDRAFT_63863 [Tremella mesenterica DSM 1558]
MLNRSLSSSNLHDLLSMEVALKPSDGDAINIKVHLLCSHSSVFKDMLTIPSSTTDKTEEETTIELDIIEADLKIIFDMMNGGEDFEKVEPIQLYSLIDLCDKYDMDGLRDRLLIRVTRHVPYDPWRAFCLASHYDIPILAVAAIRQFGLHEKTQQITLWNFPPLLCSETEPRYLSSLIHGLYSQTDHRRPKDLFSVRGFESE